MANAPSTLQQFDRYVAGGNNQQPQGQLQQDSHPIIDAVMNSPSTVNQTGYDNDANTQKLERDNQAKQRKLAAKKIRDYENASSSKAQAIKGDQIKSDGNKRKFKRGVAEVTGTYAGLKEAGATGMTGWTMIGIVVVNAALAVTTGGLGNIVAGTIVGAIAGTSVALTKNSAEFEYGKSSHKDKQQKAAQAREREIQKNKLDQQLNDARSKGYVQILAKEYMKNGVDVTPIKGQLRQDLAREIQEKGDYFSGTYAPLDDAKDLTNSGRQQPAPSNQQQGNMNQVEKDLAASRFVQLVQDEMLDPSGKYDLNSEKDAQALLYDCLSLVTHGKRELQGIKDVDGNDYNGAESLVVNTGHPAMFEMCKEAESLYARISNNASQNDAGFGPLGLVDSKGFVKQSDTSKRAGTVLKGMQEQSQKKEAERIVADMKAKAMESEKDEAAADKKVFEWSLNESGKAMQQQNATKVSLFGVVQDVANKAYQDSKSTAENDQKTYKSKIEQTIGVISNSGIAASDEEKTDILTSFVEYKNAGGTLGGLDARTSLTVVQYCGDIETNAQDIDFDTIANSKFAPHFKEPSQEIEDTVKDKSSKPEEDLGMPIDAYEDPGAEAAKWQAIQDQQSQISA